MIAICLTFLANAAITQASWFAVVAWTICAGGVVIGIVAVVAAIWGRR